tara:strand:+ start:27 stop:533 length:507 start_codon:yes stop_codon:yes gene_type:complete
MALTKVIGSGLGEIPAISGANLTGFTVSQLPVNTIIQVVQTQDATELSTTSTSYTTSTLAQAITLADNTNKVLITVSASLYIGGAFMYVTVYRNHSGISDTDIAPSSAGLAQLHAGGTQGDPIAITFLDDPQTTNEITYTVMVKVQSGTGYFGINACMSTITCMEIVV